MVGKLNTVIFYTRRKEPKSSATDHIDQSTSRPQEHVRTKPCVSCTRAVHLAAYQPTLYVARPSVPVQCSLRRTATRRPAGAIGPGPATCDTSVGMEEGEAIGIVVVATDADADADGQPEQRS